LEDDQGINIYEEFEKVEVNLLNLRFLKFRPKRVKLYLRKWNSQKTFLKEITR
jgi:hypothetical protein